MVDVRNTYGLIPVTIGQQETFPIAELVLLQRIEKLPEIFKMAELVYSAGLTSKLFWLQESRKTAGYILDGYSKADIRKDEVCCFA